MKWSKEIIDFVRENAKGRRLYEIADLVNEKFKIDMTEEQVQHIKSNHKIHSGRKKGFMLDKKYGPEFDAFVRANVEGRTVAELTKLVNERFSAELSEKKIRIYKKNKKYKSGVNTRFKKGNEPWCKGRKLPEGWGGATRFKKGDVPANTLPIGSERITKDGYIIVKVCECGNQWDRWKFKHILVWEDAHGPVPKGHMITFLDGDKKNVSIDNLAMISRQEHINMVNKNLRFNNQELTKVGISIAKLNVKIRETGKAKK